MRRRITATVQVERRITGEERDRKGNPLYTFDPPTPVGVYAITPNVSTEPDEVGRPNAVVTGWTLYAPLDTRVSAYDRVTLPAGTRTEVVGEVARWEKNPHTRVHRMLRNEGIAVTVEATKG